MTINVPFSLLNLTLSTPIIATPTQYLPLQPGQGPSRNYEFGRAFLQAAFVGVNWETADNDGNGVWFLAQAPGPNTPTQNPATAIGIKDNTIAGSTTIWKDTWSGAWTILESTSTSTGGTTGTTSNGPPTSSTASSKSGLSAGASAGIAVGVAIPALAAAIVAIIFYKRHRATANKIQGSSERETSGIGRYDQGEISHGPGFRESYKASGYGPRELESGNHTIESNRGPGPENLDTGHRVPGPVEMAG